MADGDEEVLADEDVQLAEVDLFRGVEVARRPQHDEESVAVALQLRTLVCFEGVLDRELVQVELVGQRTEFGCRGALQADPGHAVGVSRSRRNVSASVPGDAMCCPSR